MGAYPVEFNVGYPGEEIGRRSAVSRIVLASAIFAVTVILFGIATNLIYLGENLNLYVTIISAAFVVTQFLPYVLPLPALLMLLFCRRYPRWWYNLCTQALRISARVGLYLLLMRTEYSSSDVNQDFRFDIAYPNARRLNRFLPLVKWLLAAPHYILLTLFAIVWVAITPAAWVAVLATGRHPKSMFQFSVGLFRWGLRVLAYAFLLTTDRYPPFSLRP